MCGPVCVCLVYVNHPTNFQNFMMDFTQIYLVCVRFSSLDCLCCSALGCLELYGSCYLIYGKGLGSLVRLLYCNTLCTVLVLGMISLRASPKIFDALDESIKLHPFNYSNFFLVAFFVTKDSFIIKVL